MLFFLSFLTSFSFLVFEDYVFLCVCGSLYIFSFLVFDSGDYEGGLDLDWCFGSGLVVLSIWLMFMAFLVKLPEVMRLIYSACIMFLVSFCCVCFSCNNFLMYFIFFEFTFFPIGLMILFWGYNRERVSSLVYLMSYSVVGASFHILGIIFLLNSIGSASTYPCDSPMVGCMVESSVWWGLIAAYFLLKSPLFISHGWLTKAHVEAPTSASMLLAGVLLKLGVYGFFLLSMIWWPPSIFFLGLQCLGVFGCLFCSYICVRSQNIKLMIALSSVSHMSLSISFFFCSSNMSVELVYLNSIAHGLCASGMFSWAGGQYIRSSSQNSVMVSGQRLLSWDVSLSLMILLMLNCGIPPLMSFWVELFGMASLFLKWSGVWLILVAISILVLCFSCMIGVMFCFGPMSDVGVQGSSWSSMEMVGLFLHWIPAFFVFFFSNTTLF